MAVTRTQALAALKQLENEMRTNAAAIEAVLDEPLPGETREVHDTCGGPVYPLRACHVGEPIDRAERRWCPTCPPSPGAKPGSNTRHWHVETGE